MDNRYTLLIRKNGVVVNTYNQWGIVCCKVPFKAGGKTKELPKKDYYDEHGDNVFIPNKLMFEGYDAEFELAYQGQELASNPLNMSNGLAQIDAFKKWLSGNDTLAGSGATLDIYSPFSTIGRQNCYLLEISDENPFLQLKEDNGNTYNENVITFKVTFRVTDPMTNVVLSES